MTIEYKLAKQLKEAGFPQPEHWGCDICGPKKECPIKEHYKDEVYNPSLSELIEACGGQFDNLERDGEYNWKAHSTSGHEDGKTPELAVAKLWLQLEKEKIKEEKLYQELKNDRGDDSAKEFLPPEEKR